MDSGDYKGYIKTLQTNVFHGMINIINVTFIEFYKQLYSVEPGVSEQLPLSPRRNGLPVKSIDWARLMIREYSTRALIESSTH
jgi:hypothetical protein